MTNWLPIDTAPCMSCPNKMFVVIGIDIKVTETSPPYTTDPWCVWREKNGSFTRWPHPFPPTHWAPLPDYKKVVVNKDLWEVLANHPSLSDLKVTPRQYSELFIAIAGSIPKLRVVNGWDCTDAEDVKEWLLDQSMRSLSQDKGG